MMMTPKAVALHRAAATGHTLQGLLLDERQQLLHELWLPAVAVLDALAQRQQHVLPRRLAGCWVGWPT